MKKIKKMLSVIISFSLLITCLPVNVLSVGISNAVIDTNLNFSNFAKITSANYYDSNTTIINIQDLHNNKEVQDNIFKLLEKLNEQYENLEVYIEGASSLTDYNKILSSINKTDSNMFMSSLYDNDTISGAEYFGYKDNKILKPTEQKDIYDENIQNYSFLIKNRKIIEKAVSQKYSNIKTLDNYLTSEQRRFLRLYNSYLNKKISAEKFYAKVLSELQKNNISILKYINTKIYIDVLLAGQNINKKFAENQLKTVLLNLKNTISYQDYVNLLKDSDNLTDIDIVFAYLSENVSDEDKITKYPDLFKLIDLKELSSLINPLDLIEEEKQMVEDILLSYSRTTTNKEIVFLNLFYQVYKKLLFASISSNEYIYYKKNINNFYRTYNKYLTKDLFDLYVYTIVAEQFNELNYQRNLYFVNNLSSDVSVNKDYVRPFRGKIYNINKILSSLNKKKSIKVIISGGFHTQGVNSLLDEKKISYITLTPNIKNTDSLYEKKYLDSIIEQADVENNAISKKGFSEQAAEIKAKEIAAAISDIFKSLKSGKTIEEVNESIKNIIEANGVADFIDFHMADGVISLSVEDKVYYLNYKNGKVEIKTKLSTTLAKNIKTLIKQALKISGIRNIDFDEEMYGTDFLQVAEYYLVNHNILLPDFADVILSAIVKDIDPSIKDRSDDEVYKVLMEVKNSFKGTTFECDISVGRSNLLVGATPDGYGNMEEYGSLFYVVWEQNDSGSYIAKDILVSQFLLDGLKNFNEQELKSFFTSLFIHERLEILALTGQSKSFNQYIQDNKYPRISEIFHEYTRSSEFNYFLEEQQMSSENVKEQIDLLGEMDRIVADINKENSQYSDIVSVSSSEENKEFYADKDHIVNDFLSIRSGDKELIEKYSSELVGKIVEQIKNEYIAEHKADSNFDIEEYLKSEKGKQDFVKFINQFVVVYRETSKYVNCHNFAVSLKRALSDEFKNFDLPIRDIFIASYQLDEYGTDKKISLSDGNVVDGKKVLFVEDIISKQSETFNNVYNALMKYGAKKVQGVVFFDLSKEPEGKNLISDAVGDKVIKSPKQLYDVIKKVDGNVSKYLAYWLVQLPKTSQGEKTLKHLINLMDEQTVQKIMTSLMEMLKNNNLAKDVKCYEIINLILFIGFGENKNIDSITKSEMDEFLKKYDFRIKDEDKVKGVEKSKDKDGRFVLNVSYDDWKESISSLILYSYMLGYSYIDASKINNLTEKYDGHKSSNKSLIDDFCRRFNISFADQKTKLKHSYYDVDIPKQFLKKIEQQEKKLEDARKIFEYKSKELKDLNLEYDKYLEEMDKISEEYRLVVKDIMILAQQIVIDILFENKMKIDHDMFSIIIGGSLVKGNMISGSDIYYDIIVPDGTISKSIDNHFAPLYSAVLQKIGFTSYHVSKYSTTNITGTSVDEEETIPFLNFEPLEENQIYSNYRKQLINDIRTKSISKDFITEIKQNLALITKRYANISQKGKSWLDNSFYIARDDNKSFSNRWTLMTLESKFNEIIFDYIFNSENENFDVPVSVQKQIEFIRKNKILEEDIINKLEFAWKYLSAERYVKQNNTWTDMSDMERKAINDINEFVERHIIVKPKNEKYIGKIKDYNDLLESIRGFAYDNSLEIEEYGIGYNKYSHLQKWKEICSDDDADIFVKAQIIDWLTEMDSPELREKLKQLKKINKKDLSFIFDSLDAIKLIDDTFPKYSQIEGERSIQNYWDAVANTVKNPETMFALIAHKLTKAQISKDKEDQLLLYSIYLPLSKRFGNADIYEYVRNDTFECIHPAEYLNLLNIIESLYGKSYSELQKYKGTLKEQFENYLKDKNLSMDGIEIKNRVKSLYSIYEKLNSTRKNDDEELRELNDTEKAAIKFILKSQDKFCDRLIKKIDSSEGTPKEIKEQIESCIYKKFDDLSDKEKELLLKLFAQMKDAVFSDYEFVDYVKKGISLVSDKCKKDGMIDIEELKKQLNKKGDEKPLELWFVEFFESELKDLVGLHIVVDDDRYSDVIAVVEDKANIENPYSKIIRFFEESKDHILFEKFGKDEKNKQARLKLNASIKVTNGIPVPVEMCIYEKSDYEAESYGVYNQKKVSSPHYIYKMGKRIKHSFFENVFSKEMNYNFIDPTDDKKKRMIFVADGFVPSENLTDNFNKIMKNISGNITCFVEYEDAIYVQKLPEGSTVYDLATGRYFSDDINVAVYTANGDQITSDVDLTDTNTYKIVKRKGCFIEVPKTEGDIHTTRAQLIYKRKIDKRKKSLSSLIKEFGTVSDINEVIDILLDDSKKFKSMFDERKLSVADAENIASKMYDENSENKILKDEKLLTDFLKYLSNIILSKGFETILPSSFIKRSTQIANHYNLANMFELFEAIENGIIDFESIEPFYNMCLVIKTNESVPTEQIEEIIRTKYKTIRKINAKDPKYNLIINKDRYFVEGIPLVDEENQWLINLLSSNMDLSVEFVADKDDKKIEEKKDTVFISEDFIQPQKEFPLMSLGSNIESLVQHAMSNHKELVNRILQMTEEIAYSDISEIGEENMDSLFDDYPILLSQMLLGLFSQEEKEIFVYKKEKETAPEFSLSQETPFLTEENIALIGKTILEPDFSEFKDIENLFDINFSDTYNLLNVSEFHFVVSRSLDLVEDKDTFSLATFEVNDEGVVTLYVSEAFIREVDNLSKEKKEALLKQLVLHELMEYLLLLQIKNINYIDVHKIFEKYDAQKQLMEFVKNRLVPNMLRTKDAMYQEVDALLEPSNFDEMEPESTAGLLLGNLNISSFEKTYELYKEGKLNRIFISGNTRGSIRIISSLRKNPKYMTNIRKTITRLEDVKTVEDLLSLSDEEFEKLELEDKKTIEEMSDVYKNNITSNKNLSEAYIIKWVILECARQGGMSKEEIDKLEKAMVLETDAANTPQNIKNIFKQQEFVDFISDKDNIDIVLIQTPFSQSRARATLNEYLHSNEHDSVLQNKKFNIYSMNFDYSSVSDYYGEITILTKSLGEWTRLIAYTLKGDTIPIDKNKEGLNVISLPTLKNILFALTLLSDKEKDDLLKIFNGIPDFNIDTLLGNSNKKGILEKQIGVGNRYNLIANFITYLYSDTEKRKNLEKKWSKGNFEFPILDKGGVSAEGTIETTYRLLSAA